VALKMHCQEVSNLIHTMPEHNLEEIPRVVSEHLSECEACNSLYAGLQEMEEELIGSGPWFEEMARDSQLRKSTFLTEMDSLTKRRAWRLRCVWAGAAATLVLAIAGAVALFLPKRDTEPQVAVSPEPPKRVVNRATASADSFRILRKLAEVELSYEAPPFTFPDAPPKFSPDPSVPRLLQKSLSDSERTLRKMAESSIKLTGRIES
jgi:hypothetical protein